MTRRLITIALVCVLASFASAPNRVHAQDTDAPKLPLVTKVEAQPLAVQVRHLIEAMEFLGEPFSDDAKAALNKALAQQDNAKLVEAVQAALDPYCIAGVHINPESRVKVQRGPAAAQLDEGGWRQFLVKVHNEAGVTARLAAHSPQAQAVHDVRLNRGPTPKSFTPEDVRDRWLDLAMFEGRPMTPTLTGVELEYRIVQLYSRDKGKRAAVISFDVGQGSQDIGFRNDVAINFDVRESVPTMLRVLDEDGKPTIACFVFRDKLGRVYPSQAKRLAPDFAFHPQVYRGDSETITLPPGEYTAEVSRGPEYVTYTQKFFAGSKRQAVVFKLERWIDPSKRGWWSGDHHIHAAGCAHYNNPSQGVHAPDMFRHIKGEDLKVGANLTWGPCFDYQKQFFTGEIDKVSLYPYLLRYDVEVSGFGSHRSGHLCLLRLTEQMYPGGDSSTHWPTLCLNTLKWAKKQGALCGPAHSGWGLKVPGNELPNYNIPPMDSIGACEYVVDVTHLLEGPGGKLVPAVDFLSMVDTPSVWELNMWYQTLNCGYRTRVSGETDFPCIYGERVGLGRSYVKLDGKLDYDAWCEAIRKGRNYVSDGRSHIFDFRVNDADMGVKASETKLAQPGNVTVTAQVAARLDEKSDPALRDRPLDQKPYWHIERARIGDSRNVKVELILNGHAVASKVITADGSVQDIKFDNVAIDRSSWLALRIFPSSHTNPVWVLVGDDPVYPSKRSADWCLKAVEQLWTQKKPMIAEKEMNDAIAAYDHARATYRRIIEAAHDDTAASR